jgi:hypothetical protein
MALIMNEWKQGGNRELIVLNCDDIREGSGQRGQRAESEEGRQHRAMIIVGG